MTHSIEEYQGIKGISTFLTGGKLDRVALRAYLGKQKEHYFGAFATDDGIVAYKEKAMDVAFKIKADR